MKKILFSLVATFLGLFVFATPTLADTYSTNFDSFNLGTVNGQGGWSMTGPYDVEIVNNILYASFGTKSLRTSNAVVTGAFGDQTFAKLLADPAGDSEALNLSGLTGTWQKHFETQFDIASASPGAQQTGLYLSVSPDRGDGARMSYLRFEDNLGGIDVFFDDVTGTDNPANFNEIKIATLNRSIPHTVKIGMDFVDGSSNDVVKIWIDGVLKTTGTSWENYYRYDDESNPTLANNSRTVSTVLFREGGITNLPSVAGKGFLIDNFFELSGPVLTGAQKVDVCHLEGKRGTYHLINISESAKQAHLNHGDKIPGVDLTADCSQRLLTGAWGLSVNGGAYLHDMFIDSQSPTGALTGHGGYPAGGFPYSFPYNWTLTGQLTGSNILLTISYENGYTAEITGIVNNTLDGMNGGAGTGGVTDWTATR